VFCRDPLVSERILENGDAVAKGLVRRRHDGSGARCQSPVEGGIHVVHVQVDAALQRRFAFSHFENRVSDANRGINDSAGMLVESELYRAHGLLKELDVLFHIYVMHEGRDGPEILEGWSGAKMCRDVPLVAGGILHKPSPLTIDLVLRFPHGFGARVEGALVCRVAIRNVHM